MDMVKSEKRWVLSNYIRRGFFFGFLFGLIDALISVLTLLAGSNVMMYVNYFPLNWVAPIIQDFARQFGEIGPFFILILLPASLIMFYSIVGGVIGLIVGKFRK
ncbi:MAG: hypothetical protein ABH864_06540 [archaeon]